MTAFVVVVSEKSTTPSTVRDPRPRPRNAATYYSVLIALLLVSLFSALLAAQLGRKVPISGLIAEPTRINVVVAHDSSDMTGGDVTDWIAVARSAAAKSRNDTSQPVLVRSEGVRTRHCMAGGAIRNVCVSCQYAQRSCLVSVRAP